MLQYYRLNVGTYDASNKRIWASDVAELPEKSSQ